MTAPDRESLGPFLRLRRDPERGACDGVGVRRGTEEGVGRDMDPGFCAKVTSFLRSQGR